MEVSKVVNGKKGYIDPSSIVKVPPQSIPVENAILGSMLVDPSCISEVVNLLFSEVFYSSINQYIYNSILKLYDSNKSIDMVSVIEQLKKDGNLEAIGGAYVVTKLTRDAVSGVNSEDHCRLILEMYLKREAIKISADFMCEAYEEGSDAFELFDKADHRILSTQEKILGGTIKDMSYYSSQVYDQYETVKQTGVIGIQTGIIPFDKTFSGLVAPDLIIVAARPGAGKTSLALSITYTVSILGGIPGAWFSLEMDGIQLARRLASIDSGVSHEYIRQGKVPDSDELKFYRSLEKISSAPVYIEDKPNINIRSLRTRANILVRRNKIGYIVVDYLQLMEGIDIKNKNRDTIIGEITRGLKGLAKELNIPVIALSQLSREVEKRADRMPQLSDLRESGNIEQDADEVLFLMRPEYYDFTEPVQIGNREYDVRGLCIGKAAKNRHGGTHNFAMGFNAPTMHFSTHSRDAEVNSNYNF